MKKNIFNLIFIFICTQVLHSQCFTPDASIWENTWLSCQVSPNPNPTRDAGNWIMYDFGSVYSLSKTRVWNSNEPGELDRGFKTVVIDYSEDGSEWTEFGVFEFQQGTGEPIYGGFEGPDFEGKKAQFVLISANTNWGDPTCYGIAEVKFNLIPEAVEPPEGGDDDDDAPCDEEPCDEELCFTPEYSEVMFVNASEVVIFWEWVEAELFQIRIRIAGEDEWEEFELEEAEAFFEDLEPETEYEYQIQALCEEEWTEYSESFFFTTLEEMEECDLPQTSSAYLPEPNLALINWPDVPDAIKYRFRFRIKGSGASWVKTTNEDTWRELEDLEPETIYQYQIRVKCEEGWTDWTEKYEFETGEFEEEEEEGDELIDVNPDFELSNIDPSQEFLLFPNPASSEVKIYFNSDMEEMGQVQVFDLSGQLKTQSEFQFYEGKQVLDLSLYNLPSGMYLIVLQGSESQMKHAERLAVFQN